MNSPPCQIRALLPEDILLRAIRNLRHLQVREEAFLLRHDETGLSVNFDCTVEYCRHQCGEVTYGVRMLIVSSVWELDLDVVPDEPHHAQITGVPHKEENPELAEWLASRLAECSILVDSGKKKRPKSE